MIKRHPARSGAVFYWENVLKIRNFFGALLVASGFASGAQAQFMTAEEVKPILGMTQGSWVAVRVFDGQDLLYFTHLMSFRCGLDGILYGINGETPSNLYAMEPCHEGTAAPSSMDPVQFPLYVSFPVGSVHSVTVMLKYDDGSKEQASFERAQIQIQ